ncbi:urokinase plasminogen activator surface receptor-like [Labeo rohita]|uniref:urokinase plasminogen activator surface receptor-like n=1 Tax=Labeo rohita TaxID=84645 RepID=UPI0021E284E6|nr:urokinase plasminogen activator surface receptor-like [Labeo rohita]
MDLQLSVFLLFALFTAGHSLSCYQCPGTTSDSCVQSTCSNESSSCLAATVYSGDNRTVAKGCFISNGCPTGSVHLGSIKASLYCCTTDLCNAQDAPDPKNNTANGKMCYYCDGQNCSKTLSCSGTEDRCFTQSGTFNGHLLVYKGCVSKSLCDSTTFNPIVSNFTCCEGNLCNGNTDVTQSTTQSTTTQAATTKSSTQGTTKGASGAQSVTQSFLFLCFSLLSFILLH